MMLRTRFAPTPSGYLHLGNAFSFVLTWLIARKSGGEILLRIDDLDAERAKPEYVDDIFTTLAWLGLDWDAGARSAADFYAHYSQRLRLEEYNATLETLRHNACVFVCDCSRARLAELSAAVVLPDGSVVRPYPGVCRDKNLPLNLPDRAWRLQVNAPAVVHWRELALERQKGTTLVSDDASDEVSRYGDVVVRRRDGKPAYHIASLTDDMRDGVTLIVRGADLRPSTATQIFLAERLGWTEFAARVEFLHHPLTLDERGGKLSKSAGALSLQALRQQGTPPESVFAFVAANLGLPSSAGASLQNLVEAFSPSALRALAERPTLAPLKF
jgi:glutamyl-tRNA synthetase